MNWQHQQRQTTSSILEILGFTMIILWTELLKSKCISAFAKIVTNCWLSSRTLRHVAQYSPLLSENIKRQISQAPSQPSVKDRFSREQLPLSEFPLFLNERLTLKVPVYTVWGACEDVQVLEKLRSGEYKVRNLHIIDEAHSRLLEIGGVKLRLLGLGGAVVMHKLFDNGEGKTTIAGGQGTMWTTLLQMGELVDTANRVFDQTETRIFVTHASPAREGLLNQLSVTLKADFSISAGLHFRYGSSYNEFSVNPTLDHYRGKLAASKASFNDVWETVKAEVEPAVAETESQQKLLSYALDIVHKMPAVANGGSPFGGGGGQAQASGGGQVDEIAFKTLWNFNLADAAFGWLVLEIDNGRIGTEMKAQGFNFAHRGGKPSLQPGQAPPVNTSTAPSNAPSAPASATTPSGQTVQAQRNPQPQPVSQPSQSQNQAQVRTPQNQSTAATPTYQQPHQQQNQSRNASQGNRNGPMPIQTGGRDGPKQGSNQQTGVSADNKNVAEKAPSNDARPNGTTATSKAGESPSTSKADTPTLEKKSASQSLFITNAKDEEDARRPFSEDDKTKIVRFEKMRTHWLVHFKSPDEMQSVFSHVSSEYKNGKHGSLLVRVYKEYPSGRGGDPTSGSGGSSRWQGSGVGRGGSSQGGGQGGNAAAGGGQGGGNFRDRGQQGPGGYRSGGTSDSEGGRGGRGGFRGRGGSRFDRGRGRGGGGGGRDNTSKGGPNASDGMGSGNAAAAASNSAPPGRDS